MDIQDSIEVISSGIQARTVSASANGSEASIDRFQTLFECSLDALVLADDDGTFKDANVSACELFGYKREELLEMRVGDIVTPESPGAADRYQEYLRTGKESGVFTFVRPDNEVRTASYSACRLAPGQHLSVLRDITDRNRADAEIRSLNQRLHRAVYESSHRIKNQLQLLAATVDMALMDGHDSVPAEEVRRLGLQIRTLSLLQDILTVEWKSDSSGASESISSRTTLVDVLEMLRQATGSGRLDYDVADTPLPVRYATALALITNECVTNAVKHGKSRVELEFRIVEGGAVLEVCDDGPGFPDSFDPKVSGSTGMELISALVAHDLKGTVRFENRAQGGACVIATLPLPS